jgi:hypothetical protein
MATPLVTALTDALNTALREREQLRLTAEVLLDKLKREQDRQVSYYRWGYIAGQRNALKGKK